MDISKDLVTIHGEMVLLKNYNVLNFAEVIETTQQGESNTPSNNTANHSQKASSTLREETLDIYRSTLAAMKAIRGLQKARSSYNPLSFSALLKNQDDDSGAITVENSASNSSSTSQKGEEADKEDAQSLKRR
ncbi:hypothetical protein REPUB_Repub10bG0051800 [Reevesia pubescens]